MPRVGVSFTFPLLLPLFLLSFGVFGCQPLFTTNLGLFIASNSWDQWLDGVDKDVRMEGGDDLYPKWSVGLRLDLGEGLRLIWRERHG